MRKRIFSAMLFLAMVGLSACNAEEPEVTTTVSTLPVDAEGFVISATEETETPVTETTTIEETTEETTTAPPVTSETTVESTEEVMTSEEEVPEEEAFSLVPAVEQNLDSILHIGTANINGVDIDITNVTVADLLSATGISYDQFSSCDVAKEVFGGFSFNSAIFGAEKEPDPALADATIVIDGKRYNMNDFPTYGTMVSVELVDAEGNLVNYEDIDTEKFDTYKVKAVHTSDFFTHEDFEVTYYKGVKAGMLEAQVVTLLGNGTVGEDTFDKKYRAYNNGKHTMLVGFEAKTENDRTYYVVEDMFLFNN